jgi:hypothetical protein
MVEYLLGDGGRNITGSVLKPQGRGRRNNSPRSSTISVSIRSGRRFMRLNVKPPPVRRGTTTRRISNSGSRICMDGSTEEPIGRNHPAGST